MSEDNYLTTDELEESRPKGSAEDEMDLTPMVDVTFLLLIFFMITAAFAVQKALSVPPVDEDEAAPTEIVDPEEDSIVIRVDADNVFWIGAPKWEEEKRALSAAEMRSFVTEAKGEGSEGPTKVLVQAHGDARHESMVAALDAGPTVGIEEIRLLFYEDGDLDP